MRARDQRPWTWALCAVLLMAVTLAAQAPPAAFEAASIKRAVPGETGGRVQFLTGGRFVGQNVPLDFVLQQVYGVRDFQLAIAPEWKPIMADVRYYIQAKADDTVTTAALKEMLKALLADRFGLRLHTEKRDLPVYALVVARGGVKGAHPPAERPGGVEFVAPGWMRGKDVTVEGLVSALSYQKLDRPIVNLTNLNQALDFDLTWTPIAADIADPTSSSDCPASFTQIAERRNLKVAFSCPSIFTAIQDQLGLRLEKQQAPTDVLVVDSVHAPTEN